MRWLRQRENLVCQNLFNHNECIDEFDKLRARLLEIVIEEGSYYLGDAIRTDENHMAILFYWKAKMHPFSLKGIACFYLFLKFPSETRKLATRVLVEEERAKCIKK